MGAVQIYLLRHGIAEDGKPGRPDSERALTAEGKEKLRRVLKRARRADCAPSLILSSPYKRAVETAAVAADVFGYKKDVLQTRALVPEARPNECWDEIRVHKDEAAVLLASHEPLMSALAAYLLRSPALQVDMKKAAMVRVDCEQFAAEPHGVLKWMLTPGVCLE
jgi:phosphohistidine phosphatase